MKYAGIFFCAFLIGCKSPADKKILEEFKKVNEGITEKNKALSAANAYDMHYQLILLKADKYPQLVTYAKRLHNAVDSAIQYVEKIEDQLNLADKKGDDSSVPTNLLARGPQGDTLEHILWKVYERSFAPPLSTRTMYTMDSTLKELRGIPVSLNWKGAYFEQTQTGIAIVLLEDIKNDILHAAGLVMADIAGQVKE